jgi:hypothetical protein
MWNTLFAVVTALLPDVATELDALCSILSTRAAILRELGRGYPVLVPISGAAEKVRDDLTSVRVALDHLVARLVTAGDAATVAQDVARGIEALRADVVALREDLELRVIRHLDEVHHHGGGISEEGTAVHGAVIHAAAMRLTRQRDRLAIERDRLMAAVVMDRLERGLEGAEAMAAAEAVATAKPSRADLVVRVTAVRAMVLAGAAGGGLTEDGVKVVCRAIEAALDEQRATAGRAFDPKLHADLANTLTEVGSGKIATPLGKSYCLAIAHDLQLVLWALAGVDVDERPAA